MQRTALAIWGALCTGSLASAAVVNHVSVESVPSIPQSVINAAVTDRTWYLAHASIGANLIWGVGGLHDANPARYPLVTLSAGATPPASVSHGAMYEYYRGNPGWQTKVDSFKAYLDGGWGQRTDIAINKLCYVDPGADWRYYAVANDRNSALAQLELQYPNTKFIYCTIPVFCGDRNPDIVDTLIDIQNFNNNLRQWTQANGKLLFDIADILSHDPRGLPVTVDVHGTVCQSLYLGYANPDDYRHLNSAGCERLGLGIYGIAAAMVPEPAEVTMLVSVVALAVLRRPDRAASC